MRKQGKTLNLQDIKVDIEDTDPNSRYFVVSKFDGIFYSGKNAFYVNGSNLLKNNSQIFIEVLDSKEIPLNVEINPSVTTGYASFIYSINVYDTTNNGLGKIILLGTDINGRTVRWIRNVDINKNRVNYSEVTFKKTPRMEVIPIINYTSESDVQEKTVVGIFSGVSIFPMERSRIDINKPEKFEYRIISSASIFESDMNGRNILLNGEERIVKEVLNSRELLLNYPLLENNLISNKTGSFSIKYFPYYSPQNIISNLNKPIGTAEITFSDIETYTGKIYRYKIYRNSINAQYDSECISHGNFFDYEILYDSETPFRHLSQIGKFINQNIIDLNWRISPPNPSISLTHTPEISIDSMTTTGYKNLFGKNGFFVKIRSVPPDSQFYYPYIESEYSNRESESFRSNPIRLYKNIEYVISYKLKTYKKENSDSSIALYLISSQEDISKNKNYDGFGIKIHETKLSKSDKDINIKEIKDIFQIEENFTGTMFVCVEGMDITISNISLSPYTDFSYGPDVFTIRIPIDARTKNEGVKFSAELFDINNNYVQSSNVLSDIKYLDPQGITYPFNVLAVKTEVDIVNDRIEEISNGVSEVTSSINQLTSSINQLTASIDLISSSLFSVVGKDSITISSGSFQWFLKVEEDGKLSINSNQTGSLDILQNLILFGKSIETGSVNSAGTGYRLLRVLN